MNPQELKERTKQFALGVMRLIDALTRTPEGNALAGPLVRSGTSVAANYRAACRGRSGAEFISKIGVVEEEPDETALWLELIIDDRILSKKKVAPLLSEANEVVAHHGRLLHFRGAEQAAKSAISNQKSKIRT
jgi:four helix bundle protein